MTHPRTTLIARVALLACAALAGCGDLVRRPQAGAAPWWEGDPGAEAPAPSAPDSLATPTAVDSTLAPPALEPGRALLGRITASDGAAATEPAGKQLAQPPRPKPVEPPSPEVAAARARAYEDRSGPDRERVRQVNEYALWCIGNGMWEEARLHLEQALAADSLSASLHNNLGIVYERTGQRERATKEYELAGQLRPGKRLYEVNLRRLQGAFERRRDGRDSLAGGDPDDDLSGAGDPAADDPVHPNRDSGDADRTLP